MSLDLVGPKEISEMFGVHRVTVDRWRREEVLPEPEGYLAMGPVWTRSRIEKWGRETGRQEVKT